MYCKLIRILYNSTVSITARDLGQTLTRAISFITLPSQPIEYTVYYDNNNPGGSDIIISGGVGTKYISLPYSDYITRATFNISHSDNRTDIWINNEKIGSWDAGNSWNGVNWTTEITDLVKRSNGRAFCQSTEMVCRRMWFQNYNNRLL